jgi:hypothetical protein
MGSTALNDPGSNHFSNLKDLQNEPRQTETDKEQFDLAVKKHSIKSNLFLNMNFGA